MAAQGGSNGAIDNDDESLRYDNNHNFQVYGHQKFKTGAIRSYGNVIACKRMDITGCLTSDFPAALSVILVHSYYLTDTTTENGCLRKTQTLPRSDRRLPSR